MRLELERQDLRKKDGDVVRQLELACIFTLCGMKTEHKFLAYKSAFTLNYKANNFINLVTRFRRTQVLILFRNPNDQRTVRSTVKQKPFATS